MTDFRASGTIMGPAGLTAVFGMGTGGAPPVSSPESDRGAVGPPGRVGWFVIGVDPAGVTLTSQARRGKRGVTEGDSVDFIAKHRPVRGGCAGGSFEWWGEMRCVGLIAAIGPPRGPSPG